jgi:hypothetical protein
MNLALTRRWVETDHHDEKTAMKKRREALRVFNLMRDEDVSGVSGVGRVAVGVVFPSGKVVLEWLGSDTTFGIYDKLDHVERIHGHGGKTRIVFVGKARRV